MSSILVKMYRIGFGDAFHLTIPTPEGDRTILVDCGRHFQTPKGTPKTANLPVSEDAIVRQIIADATGPQGPRIDVVIATHRHQDHVSGFSSKLWGEVSVGEVWMPWTEDPTDPEAARIRRVQTGLAKRLEADVARRGITDPVVRGLVANSLGNAPAMKTLHEGFKGGPRRRFLEGKMQKLKPPILPGVAVHVLGPARDEAIIREMDPPVGQSYLRARAFSSTDASDDPRRPFDERWRCNDPVEADPRAVQLRMTDAMKAHVVELAEADPLMAAAALEKAVNGTSLVLVLEIGDAVLVLPGDAQWGTWHRILQSPKARKLLARTTFLKVGHHGSHNATPVEFVEDVLGNDFIAMASTWPVARFPRIPKKELLAALAKKTDRIARADVAPPKPFKVTDEVVSVRVPL